MSANDSYPSDCEITAGLRQRAASRAEGPEERGYAWKSCLPRAREISLLLLDVDGVMTDASILYTDSGTEFKAFSTRDGLGIRLLQEAGVEVGIITARSSEAVRRRAADLGLKHLFQGARDKLVAYEQILREQRLQPSRIAYMGDDWLDLPLLVRAGFAVAPADAVAEVKAVAHYVTRRPGGKGAVRELCELIIAARGEHEKLLARYCPEHPAVQK
ncbi:MAG: KdsC family phosphatase [Desulfurivibrio sp.]